MRVSLSVWLWPLLITPPAAFAAPSIGPAPAVEILKYELAANQDRPELCFLLSDTIARQPGAPLESFITAEPAIKLTATPRNNSLCLTGLTFGGNYIISLKAGLPGVSGVLSKDAQFKIMVPNRPPEVGFASPDDDILPRINGAGLPIRSVNVPKIAIEIFHISDRDLATRPFNKDQGEKVWQGVIETKGAPNSDTLTLLKPDSTIGSLKPGLYGASARPDDMPPDSTAIKWPTQYFTVSDLGVTAYRSAASLLVAVRSLSSAQAVSGVDVVLMARNNRELGRVRTDGNGFSKFDASLLRGREGDSPEAIYVYGAAGEFSMLGIDAAMADMQRPIAFFYADRNLYRSGDQATLTILLRNDKGAAVTKQPLSVQIIRNGGIDARTLNDQGGGSYNLSLSFSDKTLGPWLVIASLDKGNLPVGSTSLTVHGGRASSLSVSASADSAVIDPSQPSPVQIQGQYANGQPAANVPGELNVMLESSPTPFPAYGEFAFGLAEERLEPVDLEAVRFNTDMTGVISLPLKLAALPKTTKPLDAVIHANLFDPAGDAITRKISIPVANQSLLLGIRPVTPSSDWQNPVFPEDAPSHFEVIALSPDGARQEKQAAGWEIAREDFTPGWYLDGARFAYKPILKSVHVAGGLVDIPLGSPAGIDATLPSGRYRIEVFDPKGEALSSVRFRVGWAPSTAEEQSDSVEVKAGKPFYAPGETADIFVKPPYESDILLVSNDSDIRDAIVQHVPASGGTLHLDMPRDATGDLRLSVTALATQLANGSNLPRRATGVGSLAVNPASRRLEAHLDLPPKTTPQQILPIPVTVNGAGDEAAFVSITATDDNAAEDDVPDIIGDASVPSKAPISVDDVYGRIITALGLSNAPRNSRKVISSIFTISTDSDPRPRGKSVSLYSGIVALEKTGKASVPLAIPDFSGKLRIRAVAWSATRTGQAEAALQVHYPLSAELATPPALAPDDRADLTLALDNIDGPRGEYKIKLSAEGAVTLQDEAVTTVNLAEHEQRKQQIGVLAHAAGDGKIRISVEGPDGIAFARDVGVKVRSVLSPVSRHASITAKPGAPLTIDPALTVGLRPDTVTVSLSAGDASTIDLYGLAQELSVADYGSAERIIGRATPALAPPALAPADPVSALGPPRNDALAVPGFLDDSVRRLLTLQNGDGGFSQWGGSPDGDPWLTAYAVDFLSRAKASGANVPDENLGKALDFLAMNSEPKSKAAPNPADAATVSQDSLEQSAYIQKVLAANKRLTVFQLRYFTDRFIGAMHSALSVGSVVAAYAALNEKDAATAMFARALALPPPDNLRDQAMLTALLAESGMESQAILLDQLSRTAAVAASRRQYSAQEATWLFRAGSAAAVSAGGKVKLKVGAKTIDQTEPFETVMHPGDAALAQIKNLGDTPLRAAVTVSGVPAQNEARDGTGYELQRWFFDTAGKPVDPAAVRQNDFLVVVLTGRFTGEGEPHPLLVDPIAAGWTIEAAAIADPVNRYPWLKDLTGASHIDVENGRYVAVPTLAGDRHEFKLAYVARAATRGQFLLPGGAIEDMAQPNFSARGVNGRTKVDPPS